MGLNIGITNDYLKNNASVPENLQKYILWAKAREGGSPGLKPSLDLDFARNKSLIDNVTGQNLVTFTRASSATYFDSQGVLQTATTNLLLQSEDFSTSWVKDANSVLTTNIDTAPNGTTTSDKFAVGTSTFPQITQQIISDNTLTHTFSVYLKSAGLSFVQIRVRNQSATSNYFRAIFNLNTGEATLSAGFGNGSIATATATNVGNGWWRCAITGIADTSGTQLQPLLILTTDSSGTVATSSNSNATDGILLWGAQLEQSSTVGEYVPTTSTINSAPRFDHDPVTGESLGLLVEEQRVNYCLQSEAFGTSPWSANNVTITADQAVAPNGATTADTLAVTSANGTVTQPVTTTAIAMTFSVYLKRKTGTGNIDITADGTTWVTQTISDAAWTRCVVTQTAVAGTSNPGIRIVTSGDEVYAWGGQYE